jgi:hypothetical protein
MPATIMRACSGFICKVAGKKIDIAPTGPNPGKTPIRVPKTDPKKQKRIFIGWKTTWMPNKI